MSKPTPHLNTGAIHKKMMLRLQPGEMQANSSFNKSLLGGLAIRTHLDVAKMLGTSRQNVQQIERCALWKIRRRLSEYLTDLNR